MTEFFITSLLMALIIGTILGGCIIYLKYEGTTPFYIRHREKVDNLERQVAFWKNYSENLTEAWCEQCDKVDQVQDILRRDY